MSRGTKVLTTILIVVIGVLAGFSGYLFAKNTSLQGQLKNGTSTSAASGSILSSPTPTIATPTPDSSIATPAPSVSATPAPTTSVTPKPIVGAAGTYTVKSGDTMYSIALGLGVNWLDLAKANGLDATTANKIKIGQVLTVPKK